MKPKAAPSNAAWFKSRWLMACKEQEREYTECLAYRKRHVTGEEMVYVVKKGKTAQATTDKKKVLGKIITDKQNQGAEHMRVLEECDDPNDQINFETPEDYKVSAMPHPYEFTEAYTDAKYNFLVPQDFENDERIPTTNVHPHENFLKRRIRKVFTTTDRKGKSMVSNYEGYVARYSEPRQLFRINFDDGDSEDCDFVQMMEILIMHSKFGDDAGCDGITRYEQLERAKLMAHAREAQAELWKMIDNRAFNPEVDLWYEKMEKAWCHHAAEIVCGAEADEGSQPDSEKVEMAKRAVSELGTLDVPVPEHGSTPIYDDEPTNARELEAHPEKEAILKSSALEIDQMIEMDVGMLISLPEEKKLLSNKETILRSKMIIKRKYAQVNGKEQFLKWKSRLAIMGNTQEAGFDTVWSTFSPTTGFTAIRTMIALLCDPKYSVASYDLSGAFLGTRLENQAIYVRLPANIGEYSNRVLRLTRLVYGLKNSGSGFMKQLAEEILKFQERVEVETEEGDKGQTTKQ